MIIESKYKKYKNKYLNSSDGEITEKTCQFLTGGVQRTLIFYMLP